MGFSNLNAREITITVKYHTLPTLTFNNIDPDKTTVSNLREKVAPCYGINIEGVILAYSNHGNLNRMDDKTLSEVGIDSDTTLHFVYGSLAKPTNGGKCTSSSGGGK